MSQPYIVAVSDQAAAAMPVSADTSHALVTFYANMYGVSPDTMDAVIACESGFNSNAIGDKGHARGLVQINDLYHPDIPAWKAFNAIYAINYLASELSHGRGGAWTCYRHLLASGYSPRAAM